MKTRASIAGLVAIFLQCNMTLGAHHATAVQYDISKTITLKGVVSQLDWANPHAHALISVKNSKGVEERWDVELASPGGIIVSGLSRAALVPGTTLTVVGYPGKQNSTLCAKEVTLADESTATFVVGI